MKESYILRLFVDSDLKNTATANSEDRIKELAKDADESMQKQGYRRVSYFRTRVDKKHITCITVNYTRV